MLDKMLKKAIKVRTGKKAISAPVEIEVDLDSANLRGKLEARAGGVELVRIRYSLTDAKGVRRSVCHWVLVRDFYSYAPKTRLTATNRRKDHSRDEPIKPWRA